MEFECVRDLIDVTSLYRPDTDWLFVDAKGHSHRWHVDGQPATSYDPGNSHHLPTLKWVEMMPETDDYPATGYYKCRKCGEKIAPRYTSDSTTMYMPGLVRCRIDGVEVSREVFERELRIDHPELAHLLPPR